jgi:hypothetical protein
MSDYLQYRRNQKLFGKVTEPKNRTPIKKISDKKAAEIKGESKSDLDKFFEQAREAMTGKCLFCGGKTEKFNDDTYRFSIAHLLPKRKNMFPSVACHSDNFLELCHFGNSCHTNFDSGIITWEFLADSAEWKIISEKFLKIYPFILESEKRNLPEQLLKLVNPLNK